MTYTIKKSRIKSWGYEIVAKSRGQLAYHNIAPSVDAAIRMLKDRFGNEVKYRVQEETNK